MQLLTSLAICNPGAYYNNPARPTVTCNFLLKLVRASTAAPTFFPPEVIDIGKGDPFVFVDGGMIQQPLPSAFLDGKLVEPEVADR